jgi:hypothetical protein
MIFNRWSDTRDRVRQKAVLRKVMLLNDIAKRGSAILQDSPRKSNPNRPGREPYPQYPHRGA